MANKTRGLIYVKTYPTKKGTTFDKYLFKSEKGKSYPVTFSKALTARITLENWGFPQAVEIESDKYFMKKTTWADSDGVLRDSYKIVILDILDHAKAEFESIHLEDIE